METFLGWLSLHNMVTRLSYVKASASLYYVCSLFISASLTDINLKYLKMHFPTWRSQLFRHPHLISSNNIMYLRSWKCFYKYWLFYSTKSSILCCCRQSTKTQAGTAVVDDLAAVYWKKVCRQYAPAQQHLTCVQLTDQWWAAPRDRAVPAWESEEESAPSCQLSKVGDSA